MATYTYTIFDGDPSSGAQAWDDHTIEAARFAMEAEAAGLCPCDGYEVGQRLYAQVEDAEYIVGLPAYEITAEDLGLDEEREVGEAGEAVWRYEHSPTARDDGAVGCELVDADGTVLASCLWSSSDLDIDSDGCGVTYGDPARGFAGGLLQ